jgi:3-phosphoshikimate 1-carboxyvinyltransferase
MGGNLRSEAKQSAQGSIVSWPAFRLSGSIRAPGDKSISHRALLLGALASGTSQICGLLEGDDVLATAKAVSALGAKVERLANGNWQITGVGAKGFDAPDQPLDFGNAGTGVRLTMGVIAGQAIAATFTGDESLCSRPMNRVLDPLTRMGAKASSDAGRLPVTLHGTSEPKPLHHPLKIASAQVKSAILLAGLQARGATIVEEPGPSRDHTETMLGAFGAHIETGAFSDGRRQITLHGPAQLQACDVDVPGDPSSASFAMVAALIVDHSEILVENVMINPTRSGLVTCLQQAGYDIQTHNIRYSGGEQIADIEVRAGCKASLHPAPASAVTMIDEYPVLMVLAAFARGTSRFEGIGELRVKESDRIAKMAELLHAHQVSVRTGPDWMEVDGCGSVFGQDQSDVPLFISAAGDHRIAMCALLMGLGGFTPTGIISGNAIATSYPQFLQHMNQLGARMKQQAKKPVIAIDGPSASGKGTLARKLADVLHLPYLDTGLLYRATARAALAKGVSLRDEAKIAQLGANLTMPIENPDGLRDAKIGIAASKVAALPAVRAALLELQRAFANGPNGAVLDGRDIGTIVCPDADIKLWITASVEVRAKRRRQELLQRGENITEAEMLQQLQDRDARDSGRKDAPMKIADNAHLIDTSKLGIDAALAVAQKWVERKLAERD